MIVKRIANATRELGKPADWNEQTDAHCQTLPIRDVEIEGIRFMLSAHEPTPEEIAAILAGQPIILGIQGMTHPVCFLAVGDGEFSGE